ncbi:MAG: UvrD-helicase domain-containing protein [Flavobacteriaceae bacterium]|nr:UvrD-helicase domain-containing protein [Flavobacteriaceae bacterium]MBT3754104.1 UvrD-helicase domain-containing protein [Flavobacteriaceae bacterium]MBT3793853.1 UvrD-helicase domain-containing protein [Flavobacteriaceae bacterium]MBT4062804.1 UvrD-helicase domain-containing protein [Flavobacteriaceae bacterium]MBT4414753.1 UvrD-helicase domain-containing protein [Flavobacteriaceae bacterium]
MEDYLSQLNESQKLPTIHKNGPVMVIAGAGSGKTRVLTYRIAYLMEMGVDPFSILALTFTNKAAREMKSRISLIVGEEKSKNLWMGTFHSIFAKILRSEADLLGYSSNFTIYDTQDSERLIASIIKELKLDKDLYKYRNIRNRISSLKNNLVTVKTYLNNQELIQQDNESRRPLFGKIYQTYVNRCFKASAMDFDDLLLKTNELLNRYPEVLAKYQERFKYIHVDEYQDTNHSQYLIVKALADRYENLCVVGDDAQSIYGFRGANIENILNFQKDYLNSTVYRLEQNYRSTKNIVNAANSVINNNINKLDKNVWTENEVGNKINVNQSITDSEEGRFVASSIFENKNNLRLDNDSFAVLYRTNAQSRSIEDALRRKNIPYQIYGGLSFYQRKEIKDILAYLRIIINPNDEESFKRIINYPTRGIGQTTIDKLLIYSNKNNISLFNSLVLLENVDINNGTKTKLTNFLNLIKNFQILNVKLNALEIIDEVLKRIGIINLLKLDGSPEAISRIENIEALLNAVKDFIEGQEEVIGADGSLSEFLEDVALISELDKDKNETDKKVSLMTIHLAKGLEFSHVYIVGLEEDLFPSALSSTTRTDLEEERRLFYVALTRAKRQVTITYAKNRYRWGKLNDCEPSRFINEINKDYIRFNYNSNQKTNLLKSTKAANKLRFKKPNKKTPLKALNKKNIISQKSIGNSHFEDLITGDFIIHNRFGKGEVIKTEGEGSDKKAEVKFDTSGIKKILLKFAKYDICD